MRNPDGSYDFSEPVITRQEFGPDTDIKTILRRHGIGATLDPRLTRGPGTFTETNFDKDLTTAMADLKRAHEAFEALPRKYRDKYQTAEELWKANRDKYDATLDADDDNELLNPVGEPSTGETHARRKNDSHGQRPQTPEGTHPKGRAPGTDPGTESS